MSPTLCVGFFLYSPLSAHAAEVTVAVASNFSVPMRKIAQNFEVESGHTVRMSFGSTGGFYAQIKNGGPITLTHPDITRFFMSIPEAAQLVIQAGAMGTGGDVFVLDMGQPVRIYDLASRMVEMSGLRLKTADQPEGDIEITITGLRPGEKLYEELLIGHNPKPTQHARIMKANEEYLAWPQLQESLESLRMAMSVNDVPLIRNFLSQLVQGYESSGEVVDWVHQAQERVKISGD